MSLKPMFSPKTIAVVGGGSWCENTINQCRKIGFKGALYHVHPKHEKFAGLPSYKSIHDLPEAPDLTFIGINRNGTIEVLKELNEKGGKTAVCFASGFLEAKFEDENASALQEALIEAAGDVKILGPNCYGFINYLDKIAIWPDQHGGEGIDKGVAIITQSSNMAINLSMQNRGVPIGFLGTVGNQAQVGMSEIASHLLDDPRITAIGFHIEGIDNLSAFQEMVLKAHELKKPIVALKVGESDLAQAATLSHTASLAGSNGGAKALFKRLGIAQIKTLEGFLESLKLLHLTGGHLSNKILSLSCSGGEASLMADLGKFYGVEYPQLKDSQQLALKTILGDRVALANPLDYHTYIWGDMDGMAKLFEAAADGEHDMSVVVLDIPRQDRCDAKAWSDVIAPIQRANENTKKPFAIVASIGETMPEEIAKNLIENGIVPFNGMSAALEAIAACAKIRHPRTYKKVTPPAVIKSGRLMDEFSAKQALSKFGVKIPKGIFAKSIETLEKNIDGLNFPLVLKGLGSAHKTEAGLVALNLQSKDDALHAAQTMQVDEFLLEAMVEEATIELLLGIISDPAHGLLMSLGQGGIYTELYKNQEQLLLPLSRQDILGALQKLNIWPVLLGYRGKSGINIEALIDLIEAVQNFAINHHENLIELEINPILATKDEVFAVDALINLGGK